MDRLCDRCDERLADADKLHCKYCVRSLLRDLDAIPRSELPGLPSKWSGPWEAGSDGSVWGMVNGRLSDFAFDMSESDAIFLAALLNTCYPAPTATKEG